MGIARATYYDRPQRPTDDTAIVESHVRSLRCIRKLWLPSRWRRLAAAGHSIGLAEMGTRNTQAYGSPRYVDEPLVFCTESTQNLHPSSAEGGVHKLL